MSTTTTSITTTTFAVTRLRAELIDLEKDPPPHCKLYPVSKDNLFHWKAELYGPKDSPYEQGSFKLDIKVPSNYPVYAPTIIFETSIYHPNIRTSGLICVDILRYQWNSAYTLSKALLCIHLLLMNPNFTNPERREVATQYREDPDSFTKTAKEETKRHAMG